MNTNLCSQTGGCRAIGLAVAGLAIALLWVSAVRADEPAGRTPAATAREWVPRFGARDQKLSESEGATAQPNQPDTSVWTPNSRLSRLLAGFKSDDRVGGLNDSPSGWTLNGDVDGESAKLSLKNDWRCLRHDLWQDIESLWTRENLIVLLAAGGASLAVHETLDDDVAANTGRHPHRWGDGQNLFGGIGNPPHHFAAIAGLYAYSLHCQDEEVHELSKSLFNAVALTGGATVLLKASSGTGTHAPNNEPDSFGGSWPSGHTSSSFAFASVLDEYYGPKIGIPAYILAGLVGWERIDDREHDLSDVVFGAALGYVIGKTVAREHHERFYGMEIQPYADPLTGTSGVAFERRF